MFVSVLIFFLLSFVCDVVLVSFFCFSIYLFVVFFFVCFSQSFSDHGHAVKVSEYFMKCLFSLYWRVCVVCLTSYNCLLWTTQNEIKVEKSTKQHSNTLAVAIEESQSKVKETRKKNYFFSWAFVLILFVLLMLALIFVTAQCIYIHTVHFLVFIDSRAFFPKYLDIFFICIAIVSTKCRVYSWMKTIINK